MGAQREPVNIQSKGEMGMKFKNLILSLLTVSAVFIGQTANARDIDFDLPNLNLADRVSDLLNPADPTPASTCEAILNRVPLVDTAACGAKRSQCVQEITTVVAARVQAEIGQCLARTVPEPSCVRSFLEGAGQDTPAIREIIDQECPRIPAVNPAQCLLDLGRGARILNEMAAVFEAQLRGVCVAVPEENPDVGQEPPPAVDDVEQDVQDNAQIVDGGERKIAGSGCSVNGFGGGLRNLWALALGILPVLVRNFRRK